MECCGPTAIFARTEGDPAVQGRWCGLPSLAKEPDAWVSQRVEAAVRDNLQRASGTNTADRTGLKFGSAIPPT